MKTCVKCEKPKRVGQFYKNKARPDGRDEYCKVCRGEVNKDYQKRNKEAKNTRGREHYARHKDRLREEARERYHKNFWGHLKRAYGITKAQYERMVKKQKGRCAVCGDRPKRRLHVDHDHETGEIRGLLCSGCNGGLGLFKDSIPNLQAAIQYLSENSDSSVG